MFSRLSILLLFVALQLINGCSTDAVPCTKAVSAATLAAVNQTQLQKDVKIIDDYLTANGLIAQQDNGLRYIINVPGTGTVTPCLEGQVMVMYTGKLLSNGAVFDQAVDPAVFTLNGLILGWQLAFVKFTPGTQATLYVPSGYAYGAKAQPKIPANSNLIFDVKLVDVSNPQN